ncbi:MAG: hypothetical protein R2939_11575 [Kofleriaceae bacterium]
MLGTRGLIEVDLPDQPEPLCIDADVVRMASGDERGVGIQFADGGAAARRPLANLMMHWAHLGQRGGHAEASRAARE